MLVVHVIQSVHACCTCYIRSVHAIYEAYMLVDVFSILYATSLYHNNNIFFPVVVVRNNVFVKKNKDLLC